MFHMLAGENLGLIYMRQVALDDKYSHFGASRFTVDNRAFYSNKGTMSLAPLYLYPNPDKSNLFDTDEPSNAPGRRRPNLEASFIDVISNHLKLIFIPDGKGNLKKSFGPEGFFDYMYAVFRSPIYRSRYSEFLKIDFPRLPLTSDVDLFRKLCKLGEEFVGPDWIADVYIPREKRSLAFEIQWSPQSLERTLERQERYEKDNVRGIWFFQKVPKDYVSTVEAPAGIRLNNEQLIRLQSHNDLKKLPLFQLELTAEQHFVVNLYNRKIPLKEFVPALINRKIKICRIARSVPSVPIEIVFFPKECWRCGIQHHCYFVEIAYHSTCGLNWEGGSAFDPSVIKLVRQYQQTEVGKALKIGEIKKRSSNTMKSSNMSFGCPECDAVVGQHSTMEALLDFRYDRNQATAVLNTEIELDDESREIPNIHFCYPDGDAFCDGTSVLR